MKLYAFDEVDDQLELVPLAARRALDQAGIKLSRAGWLSLSVDERRALTEVGAEARVDLERVRALAQSAVPGGDGIEPRADAERGNATGGRDSRVQRCSRHRADAVGELKDDT